MIGPKKLKYKEDNHKYLSEHNYVHNDNYGDIQYI